MGRTLAPFSQLIEGEQSSLGQFRRALRKEDQRVLDELFTLARHHVASAAYASHLLPFEAMLLTMLLEEHKVVMRLQHQLAALAEHRERECCRGSDR